MPEPSPVMILYNQPANQFFEIMTPENMVYRERQAEKDGATYTERVVYRSPEVTAADIDQQRLRVKSNRLKFFAEFWETLANFRPVLVIGLGAAAVVFFWNFCLALAAAAEVLAAAVSSGLGYALGELAYLFAWVVGAIVLIAVARYGLLLAFRSKPEEISPTAPAGEKRVQNIIIQQGDGAFSHAQRFVNDRDTHAK